jgi:hypothetical protein
MFRLPAFRVAVLLCFGAFAPFGLAPLAHADHPNVLAELPPGMSLGPDDSVFWDGVTADTGDGPFAYELTLERGGQRFRAALDTPSRQDTFEIAAIDPSGTVVATNENSNQFNDEVFIEDPEPGKWTVVVEPTTATDAFFRMRAKLERVVRRPKPNSRGELLPNLRVVPPHEFGFVAPANPANGLYPPDTANPPADVGGVHPLSCTADEMAPVEAGGYGAERCLRLTSGPMNVGKGPYDMRFSLVGDVFEGEGELAPEEGTIQRAAMFQAIHKQGGELRMREAGTYSFHVTHAHFHDNNVLTYGLFEVRDRPGRTRPAIVEASEGTKSGFCPADQLFGEWGRFTQEPDGYFGEGDAPGGNCFDPNQGFLGLTRGWGDVYRWQRPGQYVEFGDLGDGRYVVRSTVDKPGEVRETDETDNTSYALIRVTGEAIELLERGRGKSPWDPKKVVFDGAGPASRF